ncbi:Linalool 8-monooxygenase [Mycolicibacterium rhodesiae JS60]|nr:Linalool 8-monooxygenase [Mycolicibacterium rhodesiae JS60]
MSKPVGVPAYEPDLYSTRAILDPYPHYAELRQLGPMVWLPKQRVFAVARYVQCKAVLRDDATFISGQGVGLAAVFNRMSSGTTLNSDGGEHDRRRKLLAHRMLPRALRELDDVVATQAKQLVADAVDRSCLDGVADLATALPVSIVPDLVGWPKDRRQHLLRWGGATFDVLGPLNRTAVRSVPASLQMLRFARKVVRQGAVLPGSMGDDILAAADAGAVSAAEAAALMVDYLVPSLDTTISGIASALALFARHPEQWDLLRADPTLLPGAVNEVLRYESPLRAFSRKVRCDTAVCDVELPAGSRVLVLYASANRDEREWDEPDVFDIRRNANRHLGFGHGAHACAGQALARLEMQAMLAALMENVARIELLGEPTWAVNNIIRCYRRLPLRLVAG